LRKGRVYLVGAGPGAYDLITLRGLEVLRKADVVVYDRIIDFRLLAEVKPGCKLVDVGKKAGDHSYSQEEINSLVIELARAGDRVVRLKGGDPFIFGRGGEEVSALSAAGIPFAVVPGVTAASAVAAGAGIPLTDRRYSSAVSLVTGHEDPEKYEPAVDWEALASSGSTLVVYMGVRNLSAVIGKLIDSGLDPGTPGALVEWGATPRQRVVTGPAAEMDSLAREAGISPPALLILGKVVELRESLRWFESRPLFGRTVLVTRARRNSRVLSRALEEEGAWCLEAPAIAIKPPEDYERVDRAIGRFGEYDWVVFTSPNGVEFLMERLRRLRVDVRDLAGPRLAAIGPSTAGCLESYGLVAALVPEDYSSSGLVTALGREPGGVAGLKFLLVQSDIAPPVLEEGLRRGGAVVDRLDAYRNVTPGELPAGVTEAVETGKIDWVTFTSASTVSGLAGLMGERMFGKLFESAKAASIGPVTSGRLRELDVPVAVQAGESTIKGLVQAMVDFERGGG